MAFVLVSIFSPTSCKNRIFGGIIRRLVHSPIRKVSLFLFGGNAWHAVTILLHIRVSLLIQ